MNGSARVVAFAFLSVIPAGNLIFPGTVHEKTWDWPNRILGRRVQLSLRSISLELHFIHRRLILLPIDVDHALEILHQHAREVAQHSYSPYSGFKVGSALRLVSGEIVSGTNVENVSFGLTMCAERSALVRAVSEFGPAIRIAAIAVANLNSAASPPCGACRQMLAEFTPPDAPVIFSTIDGLRVMPFAEIFPLAFDMKLT